MRARYNDDSEFVEFVNDDDTGTMTKQDYADIAAIEDNY